MSANEKEKTEAAYEDMMKGKKEDLAEDKWKLINYRVTMYRNYEIRYEPDTFTSASMSWSYVHESYNGPDPDPKQSDNRCGRAGSLAECREAVDDDYGYSLKDEILYKARKLVYEGLENKLNNEYIAPLGKVKELQDLFSDPDLDKEINQLEDTGWAD